jgi:predicted nucleic acid-binding protein
MLIDGAVREVGQSAHNRVRDKAGRKYPSYLLMQRVRDSGGTLPVNFGTSTFAVAETTRVILDEYILRKIVNQGIPIQYWEGVIKREKVSDRDSDALFDQILRFLQIFYTAPHMIMTWHEQPDFVAVQYLITTARLSTTDAYLVGQAREGRCTYFVTEDKPLRELLREKGKIQPIAAQDMLRLL